MEFTLQMPISNKEQWIFRFYEMTPAGKIKLESKTPSKPENLFAKKENDFYYWVAIKLNTMCTAGTPTRGHKDRKTLKGPCRIIQVFSGQ